jgi:hypothetical protein
MRARLRCLPDPCSQTVSAVTAGCLMGRKGEKPCKRPVVTQAVTQRGGRFWMGRGEVRSLEGGDPELANATWISACVFAIATTSGGFERAMKAALADRHLELVSLDAAGPLNEMIDVEDALACAFQTAEPGEPTVLTDFTDEAPGAKDADAMTMRAAAESGEAVDFRHLGRDSFSQGFVIDANETWALINIIDFGVVAFDGYTAIRIDCLIHAEIIAGSSMRHAPTPA